MRGSGLGGPRLRPRGGLHGPGGMRMGGPGPGPVPGPRGPGAGFFSSGKIPFDLTYFEGELFPRVEAPEDDSELATAILKRHTDISPSTEEIQQVQNMVTRVQGILENLILTPGTFDACQVDEIRQVGSFKQGTILAGHKTADFVVILKTLPTREAVEALCNRVADDLRQTECVRCSTTSRGFDISSLSATVRIFVTTIPPNFRKLDPELHLESKLMNEAWQAIRHARWFEENASASGIKVLIRILRDLRQRFSTLSVIPTWNLDLLAHFATVNNPKGSSLAVNQAFRRCLALMSGGLYLPGYSGSQIRGCPLSPDEQEFITTTAQFLVRLLGHGAYKIVLGIEKSGIEILSTPITLPNGVTVRPPTKVYTASEDDEDGSDEQDMDAEDDDGDSQHMENE